MVRLRFQKYSWQDFPDYSTLVADDQVMKYITGTGMTEKQAGEKFESIIKIGEESEALGYFMVLNSDGVFSGDCKLVHYKYDPSLFEIGYLLKQQFWKQGYGTAICENLLQLAATIDPNRDIVGVIDPANVASRRLLEKFGFESYYLGMEDDVPTEKLILRK